MTHTWVKLVCHAGMRNSQTLNIQFKGMCDPSNYRNLQVLMLQPKG